MNEVSNFCNDNAKSQSCVLKSVGEGCANGCATPQGCVVCSVVDPTNSLDFPPYVVNNKEVHALLLLLFLIFILAATFLRFSPSNNTFIISLSTRSLAPTYHLPRPSL